MPKSVRSTNPDSTIAPMSSNGAGVTAVLHGYRRARPEDIAECVVLRGMTRENAVSVERLRAAGITVASWSEDTRTDALIGHVCICENRIVGYCFGSPETGEVVVLAELHNTVRAGVEVRLGNDATATPGRGSR